MVKPFSLGAGIELDAKILTFGFSLNISSALLSTLGAIITSKNNDFNLLAKFKVKFLFIATIPPKALTGSVRRAFSHALSISSFSATPHGFACFIIATAGFSNSQISSKAASASFILLYESSFPCNCIDLATPILLSEVL